MTVALAILGSCSPGLEYLHKRNSLELGMLSLGRRLVRLRLKSMVVPLFFNQCNLLIRLLLASAVGEVPFMV